MSTHFSYRRSNPDEHTKELGSGTTSLSYSGTECIVNVRWKLNCPRSSDDTVVLVSYDLKVYRLVIN